MAPGSVVTAGSVSAAGSVATAESAGTAGSARSSCLLTSEEPPAGHAAFIPVRHSWPVPLSRRMLSGLTPGAGTEVRNLPGGESVVAVDVTTG